MRQFRRSARDDSGASAVEFALLFPIFMVLAMGIITTGTAFSRQINVTQAAREASRYGATLDISGMDSTLSFSQRTTNWLDATDNALMESAGNQANPIGGYDYRCVAIVVTDNVGSPTSTSRYKQTIGTGSSTYGNGSCPTTQAAPITSATYVQTVLSRDVQFFVIFINPKIHLDAVSVTPYEGKLA